jgi:DtxR family Mn-dependent transcriptional regulator
MNISLEDYMRTIYALYEELPIKEEGIKSTDIATAMGVSKPSVSSMIRKLTELGFIEAEPYSRIHLTTIGLKEARRIMHKHRVIEVFLCDVLGFGKEEVHDEAHRLEHAFSDETLKRLDKHLQKPGSSPLGKKIPRKN